MASTDDYFANNPMYFQPNQSYSGIMEACDLASSTQAPHEQSHEPDGPSNPRTVLTYLTFLEQKIGHLRGILCATPQPQQQIVSAELNCIIVQLISVSKNLVAGAGTAAPSSPHWDEGEDARSPPSANAHELPGSDSDLADADERPPPPGSYDVIQIEKQEILAPHVHFCKVCGKGFKRDANLRMHMRGHGEEYKSAAALARPTAPETAAARRRFYSCPYAGCKRNRAHRDFQPLKSPVCVKNHYRRSHCDKSHTCRRCNVKKFSVLADLRTHEKHCGRDRWVCSCGTSFSRKDKLFGHVAVFDGHTPALPAEESTDAAAFAGTGNAVSGTEQLPLSAEAVNLDQCFSDSMFDDFRCSDVKASMDAPISLDYCDFDGIDLFATAAVNFEF